MQRTYNVFYRWDQIDDYLSRGANYISSNNIDGFSNGQGLQVARKSRRAISWVAPMRALGGGQRDSDLTRMYAGDDNGNIYRLSTWTVVHTLSWKKILGIHKWWSNHLYIITKDSLTVANFNIHYISEVNAENDNWASLTTFATTFAHESIPPVVTVGSFTYVGWSSSLYVINNTGLLNNLSFPDDDVVGITLQWSSILVYSQSGLVQYWGGDVASVPTARKVLPWRIRRVSQLSGRDYITLENGQMFVGQWLSFQRVTRPKSSDRITTTNDTRLDFSAIESVQWTTVLWANDSVYFIVNDTIKGIYTYANILPWVAKWLFKTNTLNSDGNAFDSLYTMYAYERGFQRLYYSYKSWPTYALDYIDFTSEEKYNSGEVVFDVFAWWTSLKKKINFIRIALANTDATNTASLYYKVNNWSWELVRTINATTDGIYYKEKITGIDSGFKQFVDVQFKVILNGNAILTELQLDYDAIEI